MTNKVWGLQLIAEIDLEQREAIEDAIESILCPDHSGDECTLIGMASTVGSLEDVTAWMYE